ncbi:MAG TPA: hypothetical protein VF190_02330, partial [Rhodothermales bacterium]
MADRRRNIPDERERRPVAPTNGSDGAPVDGTDGKAVPPRRRSRVELSQKYIVYGIGGLLGLILLVLLIVVLVLQTDWGAERAKRLIVQRLNTLVDGAEFRAATLDGNFLGGLRLYDLTLVKTDGETLVHADTFAANYSLLPLLVNRLKIKNIDLINPRIWMEQQPDGSWDLFNVIARDDSAAVDTAETWATRLVIELDHLFLADGRVDARFFAPETDSVLLVRDLYLDMGAAQFGRKPIFQVDSLKARFSPPAQDYWADVRLGATLNDSLLAIDGFQLTSPRSSVHSSGTFAIGAEAVAEASDNIDFNLTAQPLAFDDVRPFVPGLRPGASVAIDLNLGGTQNLLLVDA